MLERTHLEQLEALERQIATLRAQLATAKRERDRARSRIAALEKAGDAMVSGALKFGMFAQAVENWRTMRGGSHE